MTLRIITNNYLILLFCFLGIVEVQAQCTPSTNLGVRKLTQHSSELYWTPGSGKAFWVDLGPEGYGPPGPSEGHFTTKNYAQLDWSTSPTHEFWVKDSCGPNDQSAWAGPFRFTPPPGPRFQQATYQYHSPRPCKVLAIADMNNDFRNDVIIGTGYTNDPSNRNKLLLYHQTSAGLSSLLPFEYKVGNDTLRSLDVGDLYGDQKPEVVVGYGDRVAVYSVKPNGGLKRDTTMYSGSRVYDVKCSDLNNDGKTDFAVYHSGENSIRIFYQDSSVRFSSQQFSCTTGKRGELDVGDLNSDGRNDLAVMTSDPPRLHIFYANTTGGFGTPVSHQSSETKDHIFEGLVVADFRSDGFDDIFISRRTPTQAALEDYWHQDSSGSLQYFEYGAGSGQVVNSGDFNCDGFLALYGILGKVPWNGGNSNICFVTLVNPNLSDLSNGPNGSSTSSYVTANKDFYHPKAIGHGDLNGDHKPDLAVADVEKGLVIFYNNTDIQPTIIHDSAMSVKTSTSNDSFSAPVESFRFSTTDTSYGFYTVRHYENRVVNLYQIITTKTDTTKWEYKAFCEDYFSDTTVYSAITQDTILIKTDTLTKVTEEKIPWDEEDYNYHLALFPNPTFGEVFIKIISGGDELKTLQVEVFDDRGQHVLSEKLRFEEKGKINLTHFADGVYHFRIKWDGRTFERSVVKQ